MNESQARTSTSCKLRKRQSASLRQQLAKPEKLSYLVLSEFVCSFFFQTFSSFRYDRIGESSNTETMCSIVSLLVVLEF